MPLISKRKGEVLTSESKRHKVDSVAPGPSKRCYEALQRLSYVQDEWHTLVRTIPSEEMELRTMIARCVGSFLNGKGGMLVFGASKTGFVYGDTINRKEEDNLRLVIDETFKKFKPMVRPDMYRVTFTPVKEVGASTHGDLRIVEIRVAPGDRYKLYQDEFHQVFLRRGQVVHGPLTPHEIKLHTLKQCTEKLLAENCFVNLLQGKGESNRVKESSDRVKEGSDRVKEGSDRVKEGSDRVKEGSDRVKESSDRVKEGSDRMKEGSDRVKKGACNGFENDRPNTTGGQADIEKGRNSQSNALKDCTNEKSQNKDAENVCIDSAKGQNDPLAKSRTVTIITAQADGGVPTKVRSIATINRSSMVQRMARGFEGLSKETAISVDDVSRVSSLSVVSMRADCLSVRSAMTGSPPHNSKDAAACSVQADSVVSERALPLVVANEEAGRVKPADPGVGATTRDAPKVTGGLGQAGCNLSQPGRVDAGASVVSGAGEDSSRDISQMKSDCTNTATPAVPSRPVYQGSTAPSTNTSTPAVPSRPSTAPSTNTSTPAVPPRPSTAPSTNTATPVPSRPSTAPSTNTATPDGPVYQGSTALSSKPVAEVIPICNKSMQQAKGTHPGNDYCPVIPSTGQSLSSVRVHGSCKENKETCSAASVAMGVNRVVPGLNQQVANHLQAPPPSLNKQHAVPALTGYQPYQAPPYPLVPLARAGCSHVGQYPGQVYYSSTIGSNNGMFSRPPPTLAPPVVYYPMLRPPSYYQ